MAIILGIVGVLAAIVIAILLYCCCCKSKGDVDDHFQNADRKSDDGKEEVKLSASSGAAKDRPTEPGNRTTPDSKLNPGES